MRDKRDMIRIHVKNGVTNLGSIRESYNTYSQGGNLYRGTTKKSNQMEFSFAPDKYSTIPQAQLAPTVKQRQVIERNKFLQTNPTFQQPISKPTGSEKVGQFMHDVGSRMLNAITTFGGSAIGDVINDISPEVANTVSKYSFGMIQPTSQEYLESNRNGQWGNRINNSANAISSQMAGELVGAGINKAMPYITKGVESIGKEALEKSMPYLTGESKIPMSGYKPKQEFWNPFSKEVKNDFKSEIDWLGWSDDAAENPDVVKHLLGIEKSTKRNGNWMRGFDIKDGKIKFNDTKYSGTPEEFVVEQSDNYRKAFPSGTTKMYRGANSHIYDYKNHSSFQDRAIFGTDNKSAAQTYGWNDDLDKPFEDFNPLGKKYIKEGTQKYIVDKGGTNTLVFPKNSPTVIGDGAGRNWRFVEYNDVIDGNTAIPNFVETHNSEMRNAIEKGSSYGKYLLDSNPLYNQEKKYLSTDAYANYVKNNKNKESVAEIRNVIDDTGSSSHAFKNPITVFAVDQHRTPIKSLRHNIMFDLNNPNIYKSLIPAGFFGYGLSQSK